MAEDDYFYPDDEQQNRGIPVSVYNAAKLNPDKEAQSVKLARERGLPSDVVSRNYDEVKRNSVLEQFQKMGLADSSPKTNEWISEPDNAKIAYDDIDSLVQIEDTFKDTTSLWEDLGTAFTNFGDTTKLNLENTFLGAGVAAADMMIPDKEEFQTGLEGGFQSVMKRALGGLPLPQNFIKSMITAAESVGIFEEEDLLRLKDDYINLTLEEIQANEKEIQALTPEDLSMWQSGIRGGIQSVVEQAPGMAMSMITRNPSWMLTPMAATVYARSYGEARKEGYDENMAALYATLQAGTEWLTEKIPADKFLKIPGLQEGWKKTMNEVGSFFLTEQITEQVATFSQSLIDYGFELDEELAQAESIGDWIDIFGTRAAVTSIATLTGTAVQGGAAVGVGTITNKFTKKTGRDTVDTAKHLNEQERIDKLIGLFQTTAVKDRDPESLRSFAKKVSEDTQSQDVYIDANRVEELQEQGVILPKSIMDELEAAQESGDDIAIPASDFFTDVATSEELATQLRDHIKLSADGTFKNDFIRNDGYLNQLLKDAEADQETFDESQRIYNEIRDKLIATGRQGSFTSKYSAQIIPAYITRASKEYGVPVAKLYEDMNFDIVGPEGRPAAGTPSTQIEDLTVGETATFYDPKGEPVDFTVKAVSDQGGVIVEDENGEEILIGDEYSLASAASGDYVLETMEGKTVNSLSDEELDAGIVRTREKLQAKKEAGQSVAGMARELNALTIEARRRDVSRGTSGTTIMDQPPAYKEAKVFYEEARDVFLEALPEDAGFEDVMVMMDDFSPGYQNVLMQLQENDWLGFDYPAQAISALFSEDIEQYEISQGLKAALGRVVNGTAQLSQEEQVSLSQDEFIDFWKDWEQSTYEIPFADGMRAVMNNEINDGQNFAMIELGKWSDGIMLKSILSSQARRGNGQAGLDALTDMADKYGMNLYLQPEAFGTLEGKMTTKQLEKWYKKAGFIEQSNGIFKREPVATLMQGRATQALTYEEVPSRRKPRKTRKVYKLMRVRASHPGMYFPLYAKPEGGALTGFTAGKWFKAEVNKVRIGSKDLAHRPGLHGVNLPVFDQGKGTVKGQQRVWVEIEIPDINTKTQKESDNSELLKNGMRKGITDRLIDVNESYDYKTNPNASNDAGGWPIAGSMKINRVVPDSEIAQILKDAGLSKQVENSMTQIDEGKAEAYNQQQPVSLQQGEFDEYEGSDVVLSDRRANHLIEYFGDRRNSNAHMIDMAPEDFLELAPKYFDFDKDTEERIEAGKLKPTFGMLDEEELRNLKQPIYLLVKKIGDNKFKVLGHEGRHRMYALQDAGIRNVPVVLINYESTDVIGPNPVLEQQKGLLGDRTDTLTIPSEPVAINEDNRGQIMKRFGDTRRGPVLYQRPKYKVKKNSKGKYMGAPNWVKKPSDLAKIRKLMRELTKLGEDGRMWYEDSAATILKAANNDPVLAEKLIQLVAIYSPQNSIAPNMSQAIKAYNQWATGVPRDKFNVRAFGGVGKETLDDKAIAVLYDNTVWSGRKTNSFYLNLMHEIVQQVGESGLDQLALPADLRQKVDEVVTVDLWVRRALGYDNDMTSDDKGSGAYSFAENELTLIADEMGWKPHQVQAALWTGIKSRYEHPQVKADTIEESVKKGYSEYKNKKGKAKWSAPTSAENKRLHMELWRKHALALDPAVAREQVAAAKFSFSDALSAMVETITWEAIPAPELDTDIMKAPAILQAEFTEKARRLLLDENGNDQLAMLVGAPIAASEAGTGGFEGAISPNNITTIIPTKPVGTYSREEVSAYARAIQYIYRQKAVPWSRADANISFAKDYGVYKPGGKRAMRKFDSYEEAVAYAKGLSYEAEVRGGSNYRGVVVTFEEALSEQAEGDFYTQLQDVFGEYVGYTKTSDNEILIGNFRDENGIPFMMSDTEFTDAIGGLNSGVNYQIRESKEVGLEGDYGPEQDWVADPKGESLLAGEGLAGSPDLQAWLDNRWEAFGQLIEEYSGDSLQEKVTKLDAPVSQASEAQLAGEQEAPVTLNQSEVISLFQDLNEAPLNPMFVSGLHRIVEKKGQPKATGQQWIKLLEKSGGKPVEMDWIGFTSFFDKNKSYTKEEVLDFIESNGIDVETVYRAGGIEDVGTGEAYESQVEFSYGYEEFVPFEDTGYAEQVEDWRDYNVLEDESGEKNNYFMENYEGYEDEYYVPAETMAEAVDKFEATLNEEQKKELELHLKGRAEEELRERYNEEPDSYTNITAEANEEQFNIKVIWSQGEMEIYSIDLGGEGYFGGGFGEISRFDRVEIEGEVYSRLEQMGKIKTEKQIAEEMEAKARDVDGLPFNVMADDKYGISSWTTPGGDRYHETILTMPDQIGPFKPDTYHFTEEGGGTAVAWLRSDIRDNGTNYFIQEVQSKRAMEGRERGFIASEQKIKEAEQVMFELAKEANSIAAENDYFGYDTFAAFATDVMQDNQRLTWYEWMDTTDLEQKEIDAITDYFKQRVRVRDLREGDVPDFPFKKSDHWQLLTLKAAIRNATMMGADHVTWTPGTIQADRYSLRSQVNSIRITNMQPESDYSKIVVLSTERGEIRLAVTEDGTVTNSNRDQITTPQPLKSVVGVAVAEQIMEPVTPENSFLNKRHKKLGRPTGNYVEGKRIENIYEKDGNFYFDFEGKTSIPLIPPSADAKLDDIKRMVQDPAYAWIEYEKGFPSMRTEISEAFFRIANEQAAYDEAAKLREIKPEEMKVGGEGLINLYDNILPKLANKFIKKFKSKIEVFDTFLGDDGSKAVTAPMMEEAGYDKDNLDNPFKFISDVESEEVTLVVRKPDGTRYQSEFANREAAEEKAAQMFREIFSTKTLGFRITPEMKAAASEGFELFQDKTKGPRGKIDLDPVTGERVINLLAGSDLSTFLHESGHLFLEMEKVFARKYGVNKRQQAILDWLGAPNFDAIDPTTKAGVEMHEKWARGFEAYLREGKAPSLALRDAFSAFKRWLTYIYKSVRQLDVEVSDEMRDIFDRLLATEEEIAIARSNPAFMQMPDTAKTAGMSDEEKIEMQKQDERAKDKAESTLLAKLLKELKQRKSKEWKAEKDPLIQEEKERLKEEPVYQVLIDAANEPMDYDTIKEIVGDDKKVMGKFIGKTQKDGVDPEVYAEAYGFKSVRDMVNQIASVQTLNKAAEQAAEERMIAKYGDIMNDGTIEAEAREAVHNEEQAKLLLKQIRAMGRKAKRAPINRDQLKARAKDAIGSMAFGEIRPDRYYRNEIRHAQNAAKATNQEEILKHKTLQLYNHYLFKEASAAREQAEKHRKYIKDVQTRDYSPNTVHPDYIQTMKMIANMYEAVKGRSKSARKKMLSDVISWYRAQSIVNQEDGEINDEFIQVQLLDPNLIEALDAKLAEEKGDGNAYIDFELPFYKDMTTEELKGVYEMLKHLRYVGGQMGDASKAQFQKEKEKLIKSVDKNGGKDKQIPDEPGRFDSAFNKTKGFFLELVNLRNLIRKLDGMKEDGQAFQKIFMEVQAGNDAKLLLTDQMAEMYKEVLSDLNNVNIKKTDKVTIIKESGEEFTLSAEGRLMLALYWGTESSQEAIMQGHKVTEQDVQDMLSFMTEDELDLVNRIWQLNEALWPQMSELSKDLYGVSPAKVEPVPYEINGVQLTGGHMRLFYGQTTAELQTEEQQLVASSPLSQTKAGSLHERVGSGGKRVMLDKSNIIRALSENIHAISMGRATKNIARMVNSRDFKDMVVQKHGMPFYETLLKTLDGVLTYKTEYESQQFLATLSKMVRTAATMKHLAFSIRNTAQQLSAWPIAAEEVGTAALLRAYTNIAQDMGKIKEIDALSPFMRNRAKLVNREAREMMDKISDNPAVAAFKKAGFLPQTIMDSLIAYPVWTARFEQAMNEHGNQAKAIIAADQAVAESVGSGSDLHLSAMFQEKRTEFIRMFTLMGSWFNAYFNRIYRSANRGDRVIDKELFLAAGTTPLISGVLAALLIADMPDEDDDEGWAEWTAKQYGSFLMGTAPILRDIASAMKGFSAKMPAATAAGALYRMPKEVERFISGEQGLFETGIDVAKAVTTIVPVAGSGQIIRMAEYWISYEEGNEGDFNMFQMALQGKTR